MVGSEPDENPSKLFYNSYIIKLQEPPIGSKLQVEWDVTKKGPGAGRG